MDVSVSSPPRQELVHHSAQYRGQKPGKPGERIDTEPSGETQVGKQNPLKTFFHEASPTSAPARQAGQIEEMERPAFGQGRAASLIYVTIICLVAVPLAWQTFSASGLSPLRPAANFNRRPR
jgi:hypothetical protein